MLRGFGASAIAHAPLVPKETKLPAVVWLVCAANHVPGDVFRYGSASKGLAFHVRVPLFGRRSDLRGGRSSMRMHPEFRHNHAVVLSSRGRYTLQNGEIEASRGSRCAQRSPSDRADCGVRRSPRGLRSRCLLESRWARPREPGFFSSRHI